MTSLCLLIKLLTMRGAQSPLQRTHPSRIKNLTSFLLFNILFNRKVEYLRPMSRVPSTHNAHHALCCLLKAGNFRWQIRTGDTSTPNHESLPRNRANIPHLRARK
ncbi:hypothetical protein CDAR_10921 [Caerostris darwini]|uniref:Secreted protein n=1 Tax=Caerostris darwini TaxID=1538125 RepID=A0AAV4W8V1_9ARAC|nr:hypothetical protein CDAR_10921 [Caerostris darwini]